MSDIENSDKELKTSLIIAVVIIGLGVIAMVSFYFMDTTNFMNKGPVGDFFGGFLSSTLNFAALSVLIGSLYMQSKELSLQRKELQRSIEVSKESVQISERQYQNLKSQHSMEVLKYKLNFMGHLMDSTLKAFQQLESVTVQQSVAHGTTSYVRSAKENFENYHKMANQKKGLPKVKASRTSLQQFLSALQSCMEYISEQRDIRDKESLRYLLLSNFNLNRLEMSNEIAKIFNQLDNSLEKFESLYAEIKEEPVNN